jgi:flagellar biosynthesis/type III secretory pathway chaperone
MTNTHHSVSVGIEQIANLLNELSQVQSELLTFLRDKTASMTSRSPEELQAMQEREASLTERLQACHDQRAHLLNAARQQGLPSDSIGQLVEAFPGGNQQEMRQQVQDASGRMRLLQHHSLTNWVLAQRALIHVSQLLEIIATGGRLQPTYGNSASVLARGSLLNSEA